MATEAQIAANRANAQKATGPRTEEGKSRTRYNATRHGLCRCIISLDDDDTNEVELLLADLMDEYQPQGPTEEILVYKMAEQFWLTKRASYYLAEHSNYNVGDDDSKQVALYLRYYTLADRAFNRNLADLLKLRKLRSQQVQPEPVAAEIGSVSQKTESPAAQPAGNPPPGPVSGSLDPVTVLFPPSADCGHRSGPQNQAA